MANCCSNSFYSATLNTPDCSIECLSLATPGAIFVGANGDIFILTGTDPCNLTHWFESGSCCINFATLTESLSVCCNEEISLTSSDGSIGIDIITGGIDFVSDFVFSFSDDYTDEFDVTHTSDVRLSDANGVTVEITSPGVFQISGNSYSGSIAPAFTPDHSTIINFYYNTATNQLYAWDSVESAWILLTHQPLPVAIYTFTKSAMAASFDGNASTSTQVGTTLTYLWSGSGPAAVVFATPTAITTTATFTVDGSYVITLTVTDSNGAVKAYSETILIEPKDRCDIKFEIPGIAFVDPDNPTESEVNTWITANGPFNNGTLLYYVGGGDSLSPDFIWYYTC